MIQCVYLYCFVFYVLVFNVWVMEKVKILVIDVIIFDFEDVVVLD